MIIEFGPSIGYDSKGRLLTLTMNAGGAEILRDHLKQFREVAIPASIADETPESVLRHLFTILDDTLRFL
jgi:hypothetical protein